MSEQGKLLEAGYQIYQLRGICIQDIRSEGERFADGGRKFFSTWARRRCPELENLRSMEGTSIAISPRELFWPGSDRISYREQQDLLAIKTLELQTYYPGVIAIMGSAPDWIDASMQHFKATGERLFGTRLGLRMTITDTVVKLNDERSDARIRVGDFKPKQGLRFDIYQSVELDNKRPDIYDGGQNVVGIMLDLGNLKNDRMIGL